MGWLAGQGGVVYYCTRTLVSASLTFLLFLLRDAFWVGEELGIPPTPSSVPRYRGVWHLGLPVHSFRWHCSSSGCTYFFCGGCWFQDLLTDREQTLMPASYQRPVSIVTEAEHPLSVQLDATFWSLTMASMPLVTAQSVVSQVLTATCGFSL